MRGRGREAESILSYGSVLYSIVGEGFSLDEAFRMRRGGGGLHICGGGEELKEKEGGESSEGRRGKRKERRRRKHDSSAPIFCPLKSIS